MIRINLLPRAKRQGPVAAGAQIWGYSYLAAAFVWCIALAFVYFSWSSDLDQALAKNADLERQIAAVKTEGGNLAELQKQLDQSKKLEGVIQSLLSARQGPARMLLELSAVLSPGRGPSVDPVKLAEMRKTSPDAGFNAGWDTRRVWVLSFQERDRACSIRGAGRNNEDVAEFLRRLSLSQIFDDVVLVRTGMQNGAKGEGPVIAFELTCKVRY